MPQSEMEFAMDMARSVAAISATDSIRALVEDLQISRDEAKLRYDTALESSNAVFAHRAREVIAAYERSIAGLMNGDDTDDDDDDA